MPTSLLASSRVASEVGVGLKTVRALPLHGAAHASRTAAKPTVRKA